MMRGFEFYDVGAQDRLYRHVGQSVGAGEKRHGDREIRVVVDLDGIRAARFGSSAKIVAHAARNVPDPGAGDLSDASTTNQHVGEDIGHRRDHVEAPAALANDFVHGGKRDAVFQGGAEDDVSAVRHKFGDRVLQAQELVLHDCATPWGERNRNGTSPDTYQIREHQAKGTTTVATRSRTRGPPPRHPRMWASVARFASLLGTRSYCDLRKIWTTAAASWIIE
jgi:hypothetical protein